MWRKTKWIFEVIEMFSDLDMLETELSDVMQNINNYRDDRGNSSLHIWWWHDRIEMCKYLIEEKKAQVDARDQKGWTPLQIAAFHGRLKVIRYLVTKG